MSDTDTTEQTIQFTINGQYVKDLSFENPGAPAIYIALQGQQPNIDVNIDIHVDSQSETQHEVELILKGECRLEDQVAFIAELKYAGLFTIEAPAEHLEPILMIECPRLLFPFARNILSDITRDGGFPALHLNPIDFLQLYQQRKAQEAANDS